MTAPAVHIPRLFEIKDGRRLWRCGCVDVHSGHAWPIVHAFAPFGWRPMLLCPRHRHGVKMTEVRR